MQPSRGGRERSVGEIAAALSARGHEVAVYCQQAPQKPEGMAVRVLGGEGSSAGMVNFARAVIRTARQEGIDIVHAALPIPGADVYQPRGGTILGNLAAKRLRRPVIAAVQGLALNLGWSRRGTALALERSCIANPATLCLGVSQKVVDEIGALYGRRENLRLVHNGVAVPEVSDDQRRLWRKEWRDRWQAGEATTVFLTVAQNFKLKGVEQTIAAFGQIARANDCRLVIVGRQSGQGRYQQQALETCPPGSVIFEPPQEDVFGLYSAADAVVLLSWYDACSRVVLEALRWGLPSLTTRLNGAAEFLADGAGIVIDTPSDIAAASEGMTRLCDPQARQAMSQACQAASAYASIDRQVDQLLELYENIMRDRAGGAG
jgi:UDP-glucose:(heptosyl)LPS alpha-1,3-glucosyltransferase